MSKLLSLTSLASAVVLATTFAITPAAAYGGHGGHGGGAHMGGHYHFSQKFTGHVHQSHPRYIGHLSHLGHHPEHHGHHWHHWRHGSYRWAYGVPVAVGVAGVAAYAATAPAPVCTCLTKQYLDNGAVVFTDTCTNETAIAMPPAPVK